MESTTDTKPHIIVQEPWGRNSALVSVHNFKWTDSGRKPHVNFYGKFPPNGSKFYVGESYLGGRGNQAIMRNLLNEDGTGSKYHITVYHESGNLGTAKSQFKNHVD